MNKKKWNSLPKDIQQKINEKCGLSASVWSGENEFDALYPLAKEKMKSENIDMREHTVSEAEVKKWTEIAGKPIWDEWLKMNIDKGRSEAKQILDRTLELINTYNP